MKKKILISAFIFVVIVGAVLALTVFRNGKSNGPVYKMEALAKGNIEALVVTTGTLNPVTLVDVGSQVSGKIENIYVDPLVQPVSTSNHFGVEFMNAIEKIIHTFKGIHTVCGLSNISFGLPKRPFLNQTFVSMAIAKGLDGAIINPLDKKMMGNIVAANALAGKDDFCMQYLKAYRAKKLEF